MKPDNFRRQIFRDSNQWNHGLRTILKTLDGGGVSLFSRPRFSDWVIQSDVAGSVGSLAVDDCGRIFWIHPSNGWLYRYDPISKMAEPITSLIECDKTLVGCDKKESPLPFGRILFMDRRLWILDRQKSRLIALRTDTFQIIAEIRLCNPRDIAWSSGLLFSLDDKGIASYDVNGNLRQPPRCDQLENPIALSADPFGKWLSVIDSCYRGFRRFKSDGSFHDEIGNFNDIKAGFQPSQLATHSEGNLFVCDGSSIMHEFSADGGYIGGTDDISAFTNVMGMAFDPSGDLYIGAPEGIAQFTEKTGLAGRSGVFYSNTLDSGGDGTDCWHRVDLVADLDAGGAVDVYYATDDNRGLSEAVDTVIKGDKSTAAKAKALDELMAGRWIGPDELRTFSAAEVAEDAASHSDFRERTTHSVMFREQTRRYLWLKLELTGLAPGAKAEVSEMRVYYPRLSYLRYLPAVYQEDPASREFLQRYLSIFETVFSGLEATIERLPEVFDPEHTPKEFLEWLAQWLDLGMEEDWPTDVKSDLIRQAALLYQKKGTPEGLVKFIQIVTKKRLLIQESFETDQPFVLGKSSHLGFGMRVFRHPTAEVSRTQRTVLGLSTLGTSQIRGTTQVPVEPYRAAAHHFTLLLDLSPPEFARYERSLHRIIRDNAPAHVGYDIRLVSGLGLGPNLALELNSTIEDPQPLCVGHSILGRSILSGFRYGPELGIDAMLAGDAYGSKEIPAIF